MNPLAAMTTDLAIATIAYGNQSVPLHKRPHWRPVPRCPYRRLKELTPTSRWFALPAANAETLWETHVALELGAPNSSCHHGATPLQRLIS